MNEETPRLPALQAELARIGAEAADWANVEASGSTDLVHVGSADPEHMRERMIEVRREAREKSKELAAAAKNVRDEIESELHRQRSEMRAQMDAAMAALEPLQAQVKRMEEGIWTVNLYLGSSEEIVTLRAGTPTPIDTPVTLRTTVLAMDEEVAAFPVDTDGTDWQGMDHRDIEMFDRWLTENPAHLAQVLPEQRGVVVFTPRRTTKVYDEDPMINALKNEANFESYWLIRNDENLYRLRTDFKVGDSLMPTTSEFTSLFRVSRYNPAIGSFETFDVLPGTPEWAKAEKAQDAKRRHYMRVGLILQGLIDRTDMFAPLHAAVNVMNQRTYDDGHVIVINDTDNAIATSRQPYYEWIQQLNAELRPGMRILGNFHAEGFRDFVHNWRTDREDSSQNMRLSPMTAEYPASNVIHYLDGRKDDGFVIRYQRTEEVYDPKLWVPSKTRPGWGHTGGYRLPKQRASAVIKPGDTFVIPFDLVTEDEMQTYLDARTERHAYAESFPLLQAAIAAKKSERAEEEPFRNLLKQVLANDNDQDPEDVAPHLDALVHRFKLGNKWHRPLVSLSSEDEAKAIRLIRSEYKRIVNSGATADRDAHAVAAMRALDPAIMFVGRLSSGKYVAFSPQPRTWPEGVVAGNLWVREHTTSKTARTITSHDWVIPGVRGNKMTALYTDDTWESWDTISTARDDLTDNEMADAVAVAKAESMELLRREHGEQVEFLAAAHARGSRTIVVYATDTTPAPTRVRMAEGKPKRQWLSTTTVWNRKHSEVVTRFSNRVKEEKWSLERPDSMWDRPPDDERSLTHPWAGSRSARESLALIETDQQVLAAAEQAFRETRKVNRVRDELTTRIHTAGRWISEQQERVQTDAIKAKFLAEYPDPEMWEERRRVLTKDVRPGLDVSDDWHFTRRVPIEGTKGSHRLLERDDAHLRFDKVLEALIDAGFIEWDGLTVSDAYRLLDADLPDVYQPIAHLLLTSPATAEADES